MMLQTPAENLIRSVAGDDLEGLPVYVVAFEELADYEPRLRGGRCAAWTNSVCDLMLSDWLRQQERWQGRGFACVVHRSLFDTWRETLAAVLHELGHHISEPHWDYPAAQDNIAAGLSLLEAVPLKWADKFEPLKVPATPPWYQHGKQFVRTCCHLAQRTEDCMQSIRPSTMRFTRPYLGLSEDTFMTSLADELGTPGSIRNILATEPPEAFSKLWASATDWWEQ